MTTSTSHPYINRQIQVSMTICTVPLGVLCKCMGVPIVRCVSVGGMEGGREKLSGRSDSPVRVAKRCAGQPARWLVAWLPDRSLAGFAQVALCCWTVGAILSHRIGYSNTDSQYSVLSRFLSVRLSRPDSALSSSANHDSYRHTHWSTIPAL